MHQDFRLTCARSRKPEKRLFGNDLAKTLQELKTTNKVMTKNSSDARHYKRITGHPEQEHNQWEQIQSSQINSNSWLSPIQEN